MMKANGTEVKVVLLTGSNSRHEQPTSVHEHRTDRLWKKVHAVVTELGYSCETIDLNKLDFQEDESVDKFFDAAIVIMVGHAVRGGWRAECCDSCR